MSVTTTSNSDLITVLRSSLYPGAKTESIELVLAYCRVNGLDPMLKPVHIVPTSVKTEHGWETRDVLMPGIADYRIKAARSGEYLGKSEPMFGEVISEKLDGVSVSYPLWCKITVTRMVGGQRAEFTATEFWTENYATRKRDSMAPNAMWQKRAFGQLAKCAEAQALRMAFPEFSGGQPTAEEMEGKTFIGPTIEARAEPEAQPQEPPKRTLGQFIDALEIELRAAETWEAVAAIVERDDVRRARDVAKNGMADRLSDMIDAAQERCMAQTSDTEGTTP
jgi:phage recombination protein Bet